MNLFPHHIGHYIGLDVHDSPGFLRSEKLEKGMCITIEPCVLREHSPIPEDPDKANVWITAASMFQLMIRVGDIQSISEAWGYVLKTAFVWIQEVLMYSVLKPLRRYASDLSRLLGDYGVRTFGMLMFLQVEDIEALRR